MRRFLVCAALSLVLVTAAVANNPQAAQTPELGWWVGKVSSLSGGNLAFHSTGFVFVVRSRAYVITTLHTFTDIRRVHGEDAPVFLTLPGLPEPYRLLPVMSVPGEDSIVFAFEELFLEPAEETVYDYGPSSKPGEELLVVGYSGAKSGEPLPQMLREEFLALASLDFETDVITVPPRRGGSGSIVILCRTDIPLFGLSGGPVLDPESLRLVGMVKGFGLGGNEALHKRIGAWRFHIIVRLDDTMRAISQLRR